MNALNPRNILGGIPGLFDESEYESESSLISSAAQGVGGIFQDILSLGQDIAGVEDKSSSETQSETNKLAIGGQTELKFDHEKAKLEEELKNKKEADRKKGFFQNIDEQKRVQEAKDRMLIEEEINDIAANMSTEEKNRLLHYQSSYKDKSIYQIAALRKKIIEERRKADQQQKSASIPSPAKQPSALEGAFEGRSGNQGSGTANLSANAAG